MFVDMDAPSIDAWDENRAALQSTFEPASSLAIGPSWCRRSSEVDFKFQSVASWDGSDERVLVTRCLASDERI